MEYKCKPSFSRAKKGGKKNTIAVSETDIGPTSSFKVMERLWSLSTEIEIEKTSGSQTRSGQIEAGISNMEPET